LESTLPPMKLEINGAKSNEEWNQTVTEPGTNRLPENDNMARSMPPAAGGGSKPDGTNPFDKGYDEYTISPISTQPHNDITPINHATTHNHNNTTNDDSNHDYINHFNSHSNGISPISPTSNNHNNDSLASPHWPASRTHSNPDVPVSTSTAFPLPSPKGSPIPQSQSSHTPYSTTEDKSQRPGLPTSNTLPLQPLHHNAWLDDEEDEFAEKEVKMTFG
ncbi:MAG: hypothetical protein Q9168_008397, partial [Polycauliona sp. 1 TL-2023]